MIFFPNQSGDIKNGCVDDGYILYPKASSNLSNTAIKIIWTYGADIKKPENHLVLKGLRLVWLLMLTARDVYHLSWSLFAAISSLFAAYFGAQFGKWLQMSLPVVQVTSKNRLFVDISDILLVMLVLEPQWKCSRGFY